MVLLDESRKFVVDYIGSVSRFQNAMQKFPIKKILYRNLFRGKGLEFDSYRVFEQDDDASLIDWKASIRAQSLLARKYVEERDLHIYFLIDVSNSMLFGSREKLKAEYAAELVLSLAHLILESGDKVSILLFNEGVVRYIPPGNGRKHFFKLVNILSDPKNYGGNFAMENSVHFLLNTINSTYNVFILVTDFLKIRIGSEKMFSLLRSRAETLAIMVRDPLDEEMPQTKYQLSISDPYSNRQVILDPELAREGYKRVVDEQKKKVRNIMLSAGVDMIELNTAKDFFLPVAGFLRRRGGDTRV